MVKSKMRELNDSQREAVEHINGPMLIIAGPGSGKTYTLVERIFHLITKQGVEAGNIMVATFTEKAAQELITRASTRLLENSVNVNLNEMYIGTIHSICLRILDEYRDFTRIRRSYTVMDQFDQQYYLYQNLSRFTSIGNIEMVIGDMRKTSRWDQAELLMKWLNKVSEEYIDLENTLSSPDPQIRAIAECYQVYMSLLDEENALDFSTIQSETVELLEKHPDILTELQEKIQYIMVDEYQDTNTVQETIIFKLGSKHRNICVVGDDDQGVYRFRGATIRNILEFPMNFAPDECRRVELTVNYRSHPDIIQFYNQWMGYVEWEENGASFRFDKLIRPRDGEFVDTPAVVKVSGQHQAENWHNEIYDFLQELRTKSVVTDWKQVAFLFKSVKSEKVVALAQELERRGIPVYSPRSNMFFDREEVRLMIGALIFLFPQFPQVRQWSQEAYLPVWEYYDGCFKQFTDQLRLSENRELLDWGRKRAKKHLTLSENTDYAFLHLFYELLQFPLFNKYIKDSSSVGILDMRSARNFALFSKLLAKFEYLHRVSVFTPKNLDKNIRYLFNQYLRFLMDGGINEYEDDSKYAPNGCVSFLTIHQSKGLEFPIVIVGSLYDIPRKQHTELDEKLQNQYYRKQPFEPLQQTKIFDFWRLYYTAYSRAQNLLVLSCQEHVSSSRGERNVPSKYFHSVYNNLPSWRDPEFSLEKVALGSVKDRNLKKEYSFTSHISVFENCSLQYRFFKELEFSPVRQNAPLFGMLVHQTIEDIHKCVLRSEERLINEEQVTAWFDRNYVLLTKKERVYLAPQSQKVALEQILRYVERQGKDWSRIKEVEVDVSLVKDRYILKGTIDLIRGQDDTVEIVDFKSEKKPDLYLEREKLERYHRQLEVYAHLVEKRTGLKVSKLHLYYTGEKNGIPYVTFKKDSKSIEHTIRAFDNIVDRIESEDFSVKERPAKLCLECDMRFYCDRN